MSSLLDPPEAQEELRQVLSFFLVGSCGDDNNNNDDGNHGTILDDDDHERDTQASWQMNAKEQQKQQELQGRFPPDEWKYILIGMRIGAMIASSSY